MENHNLLHSIQKYELEKAQVIILALDKIKKDFTDVERRELVEKFMYLIADYTDIGEEHNSPLENIIHT
tara:strand:- start:192 stop:398 length:207 start_codon:yes stop_codon:yes gene_type:complete